uniref:HNH endonuclease n=1 Tax=Gordonia sp. B7-2 TaxID=3420932 RepID=UPI003D8D7D8D
MPNTAVTSLSDTMFDHTPADKLSTPELTERVVGYSGQIAAITARFLEYLAVFDDRHAWSGEGIRSCAHWLSWRTGLSLRTAQDHIRVAHALTTLPAIRTAFAQGRITYSKVRALTRVATPIRENELLNVALSATAAQVERLVKSIRNIDALDPDTGMPLEPTAVRRSKGNWRWHCDGTLSVSLRLSPVDGAAFLAAVVRAEYERLRTSGDADVPRNALTDPETAGPTDGNLKEPGERIDLWRGVPHDISAAVIAMADTTRTLTDVPELTRGAEIIVHKPLEDDLEDPHLEDGPALTDAEVDTLECGASAREIGKRQGVTLRWGRKRRPPTTALVRMISGRDQHECAHPGCGRTRHLHLHHVRPWSKGGTTDPDNLILLCSAHHAALHRGVFGITAHGNQHFTFHRPDGTPIDTAPPTRAPNPWHPDPDIAPDATTPVGGGRLNLGYTTEVLYAAWAYKTERADAVETVAA